MTQTLPPGVTPNSPNILPSGQVVPETGSYAHLAQTARTIETPPIPEYVARLVNEGPVLFRARYLTSIYEIPPNSQMIVPWEVMVNFLGNPYAMNRPGRMDRNEYLKRLRVKYGAYDDDALWDENKPRVAAYNVSTGERYLTIVDDPEGSTLHSSRTTLADQAALESQLAAMKQQLEVLQQLAMQNAGGGVQEPSIAPAPPSITPDQTVSVPAFSTIPKPNPHGVFDSPPPNAVPLLPSSGAVEDTP